MKKFLPLIAVAIILLGCKKNNEISQRPFLREKFGGKYENVISSSSNTPVDLNNDGVESTNLLNENSLILFDAFLVFHISLESENEYEFTLSEWWPTENEERPGITEVIPMYDGPTNGKGYRPLSNYFKGTFADDLKSADFELISAYDERNTLIELDIEFLEDETIKAIAKRKLYTSKGWVTTEIESVYKRTSKE